MNHRRSNPLVRIFFLLLILALGFSSGRAAQDVWEEVERIVAVGDVHGDYEKFVAVLKSAGLVDAKVKWSGGKTHLVQTGDVLDRGADCRKVMDLLMRLEREAKKAGGYVHFLIGNHEAMNIYGDWRYVSPEDFAAFRTRNSKRLRELYYEQHVKDLKNFPPPEGLPTFDAAYRREWKSKRPLGYIERRFQFGPHGKYGRWLLRHNAVVKVNDSVFMHGGISPKYADMSVRDINKKVRSELRNFSKLNGGIVIDPEGPLWYRGLAQEDEKKLQEHVGTVLKNLECRRIVLAHSTTPGAVLPRFGGRVILIEVGLPKSYGGHVACLVIEKHHPYALHRGKKLELPTDSGLGLIRYLEKAAALEPLNGRLKLFIRELEARQSRPATP